MKESSIKADSKINSVFLGLYFVYMIDSLAFTFNRTFIIMCCCDVSACCCGCTTMQKGVFIWALIDAGKFLGHISDCDSIVGI